MAGISPLLALPAELVYQILGSLPATSLALISQTCRLLCFLATDDRLWYPLVQQNIPAVQLTSPSPCRTFKELYTAYHPSWFLPRNKVWFSDTPHTGKLVIVRYDPRRGSIEGYRLVAEHGNHTFEVWEWNQDVIIHTFAPRVRLWLDDPIVKLDLNSFKSESDDRRTQREVRMETGSAVQGIHSLLFFARRILPSLQDKSMALWPPRILPAPHRVRNESRDHFRGSGHKPQSFEEMSDMTFRIRKWMEFTHMGQPASVRMGEDVSTFSTLPEDCYTPTKEKPWQGIWVGDYSGHGCEFLVIIQSSKKERPTSSRISSSSSSTSYASAMMEQPSEDTNGIGDEQVHDGNEEEEDEQEDDKDDDDPTYRGCLEAIKLTGDPNVPRGEYTWIAKDIGKKGFIRVADEATFRGARVVRSWGHIAGRFFKDGN